MKILKNIYKEINLKLLLNFCPLFDSSVPDHDSNASFNILLKNYPLLATSEALIFQLLMFFLDFSFKFMLKYCHYFIYFFYETEILAHFNTIIL